MKKRFWRRTQYLLLSLLGCLLVLLAWGLVEPYVLARSVVAAEIPALSRLWQGKRIAVISDFQFGMWMANASTVERAIDQIIQDRPAAALIAGDFVYKPGENLTPELDRVIELVRPLTAAQIPTYAVLGNHDYDVKTLTQASAAGQQRANQIQQALESIGIQVLQNEAIVLPNADQTLGNERLYLVGIGAYLPKQSQPLAAIAQVPNNAARFVLMHNPASFAELPAGTAPIAVAGHTHGGQIRIPFLPQWSWMTFVESKPSWSWLSQIKGDVVRVSGWIPGYGNAGNRLYINRGIGFSYLPIRFNCSPELTIFTLQAKT
ncbi:metallophosphoesterase [Microcoleus sp. FACHB-1515]|uniref:metallophosphoesterase n=1 Tax=Cyanophyceae TaxID=3028117 RepID=UPI0016886E9F|nr:metallophosphoesterase [Microcoleus sp. FACHB-1515]MBD2093465.1 metallophosphoesterase [Microcoleus sp. FACHB-1515]